MRVPEGARGVGVGVDGRSRSARQRLARLRHELKVAVIVEVAEGAVDHVEVLVREEGALGIDVLARLARLERVQRR